VYQPAEHILWDAWFVEVDGIHHAYYLQAPKGLADPEQRHAMAEVGHAVSRDLVTWEERGTAFSQGRPGSFDDGSVWSGSVAVHDGLAHFFYTGISRAHGYTLQRIGHAVSDDLDRFVRVTTEPILDADPAWYATTGGPDGNLHWRDPHPVIVDGRVHLYITARSNRGPWDERGTIALATSDDWRHWIVHPPVAELGHFWMMEVPQVLERADRWWLVASASAAWHSQRRRGAGAGDAHGGLVVYVADAPTGPYRPARDAFLLGDPLGSHYTGKIVATPDGDRLVASRFLDATGAFVGELSDPLAVEWRADGPHIDAAPLAGRVTVPEAEGRCRSA